MAQIRRRDRGKDGEWIRRFLHRAPFGHLATIADGRPLLNSNLFVYDEAAHAIFVHTARTGQTPATVGRGSLATFSAAVMGRLLPATDALEFSVEYSSVVVFGTVARVTGNAEKGRVMQLMMDKYAPHLRPGRDYRPITDDELRRTAVHRVDIEDWSGKEKVAAPDFPGAYVPDPLVPPAVPEIDGTGAGPPEQEDEMQTPGSRSGRGRQSSTDRILHIAVVTAADGVLFTAVETSEQALRARLAEFAHANAPPKLWPRHSAEVLRRLQQGEIDRAVNLYFERVGQRWDPEYLHRQVVVSPLQDA